MIPREIILARNAFASLMAVYNVITGRTSINYVCFNCDLEKLVEIK